MGIGVGGGYIVHVQSLKRALTIENLCTIEDVVEFVQTRASRNPEVDDLVACIKHDCLMTGLTSSTIERISRLHIAYGHDDGLHGYAINVVWTTVLHVIISRDVILLFD